MAIDDLDALLAAATQPSNSASGTRILGLLRSNDPPDDAERATIHRAASALDDRLSLLRNEVARLESQLKALHTELHTLSARREELDTLVSPLRRLPNELLIEIFTHTLPSTSAVMEYGLYREFKLDMSPWCLMRVSSRWRRVAITTRTLWSRVVVIFSQRLNVVSYPARLLEVHLDRAAELTISFYGDETSPIEPQRAAMELLMQHAHKWVYCSIILTPGLFAVLNTLPGARLTGLRRAYLSWDETEGTLVDGQDAPVTFLDGAPCLDQVCVTVRDHYVPVSLPAANLTWYSIDAPWSVHRGLLKTAANLETVHVHVDVVEHHPDWAAHIDEPIRLDRLRRLYASHPEVLDYLIAPSLAECSLRVEDDDAIFMQSLARLVRRSGCTLRTLCVSGSLTRAIIPPILAEDALLSLDTLRFIFTPDLVTRPDISGIIDELTTPLPGTESIRHLAFSVGNLHALDCTSFVEMVYSRLHCDGYALRELSLLILDINPDSESEKSQDDSDLAALEKLENNAELDCLLLLGEAWIPDVINDWLFTFN
ncbi:ABC protein [Mycena kentingensis (nom. inval.)]|nr:ABC protein [Mycena kentingensis (nom. inval.)]